MRKRLDAKRITHLLEQKVHIRVINLPARHPGDQLDADSAVSSRMAPERSKPILTRPLSGRCNGSNMSSFSSRVVVGCAAACLAGCGGGGGDGEEGQGADFSATYDVANISATAFQNQLAGVTAFDTADASVSVVATVRGTVSGPLYAMIVDDGHGFEGSSVSIQSIGGGRYSAKFSPNVSLQPGQYAGALNLQLCKDAACSARYSLDAPALPYTVTITPQLSVDFYVNGALVTTQRSGLGMNYSTTVPNGATVEMRSSIPVEWMYSSGPGFVDVTIDPASTSTVWRAQLTLAATPSTFAFNASPMPTDSSRGVQIPPSFGMTLVP